MYYVFTLTPPFYLVFTQTEDGPELTHCPYGVLVIKSSTVAKVGGIVTKQQRGARRRYSENYSDSLLYELQF